MTGGDFDVLVVGAGPSGLLAACELLRRGVRVRIVDRAPEQVTAPKALSIWPRALDILDDLGVLDQVRRESVPINALSYFSARQPLASFRFPPDLACRTLPQHVTERLITERLQELGGKVERGVRLLGLDDIDFSGGPSEGVTAILEHESGTVERVQAPFVIGADGASSAVRGQLGVAFEGSTYEMAFALIDARISGSLPPDETLFYQSPSGALVIVPMPDGIFRFLSIMPRGEAAVTVAMMQAVIDDRGPEGLRITEPVWQAVFRVHARQAAEFQRGRVFLMGDAAHVHSPAGGQGMNNGLQDAQNLAWKLAAVIHGHSPASLLSTYGPERSEATRRIVRDTDLQTRAWVADSPAKIVARDAAFRLLDRSGAMSRFYAPVMAGRRVAYPPVRVSQRPGGWAPCLLRRRMPGSVAIGAVFPRRLALSYGISGPAADPLNWTVAVVAATDNPDWLGRIGRIAARRPHLRLRRLDRDGALGDLGCRRPGYYLIRPDGHIAAHGHQRDLDRLETELDVAFGSFAGK